MGSTATGWNPAAGKGAFTVAIDIDAKERVRQAVDIVDLVGSYLELRREGRIYKSLCPWHDDHKPSMQINPDRQSYKCWVCGEGGDIFSFVMRKENVAFPEALAMLAERAGVELKQATLAPGSPKPDELKRKMYKAMAWALDQYTRYLQSAPEAEAARLYLDERGLTQDTIDRFRLGYAAPQWDWLLRRGGEQFTPALLERVGLLGVGDHGHYDRFKGRVLFPIFDLQSRPVALGGRILPGANSNMAKYVNSPETPLFSKSSLLYALDVARDTITKSRTAIVMEGYTDVLIAHQTGITNAVAVLGTALTEKHLPLLKRFADRVVLVLDGDEAGRRRTNDLLQLFLASQVDLRVLTLPDELDPCDFLLDHGADEFRRLLDLAPEALEHVFEQNSAAAKLGGTHAENEAVNAILSALAAAPRLAQGTTSEMRLKEDQILNRTSHRYGLQEQTLRQRLTQLRNGRRPTTNRPAEPSPDQPTPSPSVPAVGAPWERELLGLILFDPSLLPRLRQRICYDLLTGSITRQLYLKCCDLADDDETPTFNRLLLEYDDPSTKRWLVELDDLESSTTPSETRLSSLFLCLQRLELQARSRTARQTLERTPLDSTSQAQILRQHIEAKRLRLRPTPPLE